MLYITHMIIIHHTHQVLLQYQSARPLCSYSIYYLPTREYTLLPPLPGDLILRLTAV
jgi:hypothetical protein